MSDNESDYYSDSLEDEEESVKISNKKPISINAVKKFGNYVEDDSEAEDSEIDDAEEDNDIIEDHVNHDDIDDDIDDVQVGGVEDYPDEDDIDDNHEEELDDDDDDDEIHEENLNVDKNQKTIKPKKITQLIIDEDEDEDEYEDNYLQKFDNEINKNYIEEFHPECLNHNNDEVAKLSKVIKDENNIIIDPLHRTLPYLTKYEKARVLGQRAKQIETGAKPFVKVPENIIDSYIIAELELREKKIPFIIKRPIPGGAFEYWNLKDLEIINF